MDEKLLPEVGEIIQLDSLMGTRFIVASRHEGGMGVVYRLSQMNPLLPDMAFKLLAAGADFSLAEREARIWISIGTGPFIAKAHWGGMWRGKPAILSQWYPGVASSINPGHWLSNDFIEFAQNLILGLRYAYDVGGIIHRDIKPSNILMDGRLRPHITDFGISLLAASPVDGVSAIRDAIFESNRTIVTRNTAGTPPYMAPELFCGAGATVITDIYSLGVTLYQLLTNEHPYAGPETKGRFSPSLRMAPLDAAINQLPAQKEVVRTLILSCVELNPTFRGPNYEHLLALFPNKSSDLNVGSQNVELSDDYVDAAAIVNIATTHRDQGNPELAQRVLQEALVRKPNNPLILSAWGNHSARKGNWKEGISAWEKACHELEKVNGLYSGAVYLEPLANLSRNLILNCYYERAATWLKKGRNWGEIHSITPTIFFPEFGWLYLYEGKITDAFFPLKQHLMKTRADVDAAAWLALARVLSDCGQEAEIPICRTFECIQKWGPITTIAALVTAISGNSQVARDLRKRAISEFEMRNTTEGLPFHKAIGLPDLSVGSLTSILPDLIRMLDAAITGGNNREMVR